MKTQIIQLEAHDDTISVKDKIDWSQTPRVLLIWPERGKVLTKRLDLVLLDRYCSSHGSQLALLTEDQDVRYQALEAGIPVFQSRNEAQLQSWRKPQRELRRNNLMNLAVEPRDQDEIKRAETPIRLEIPIWGRIIIFSIGVLAVLAIAGLLLPSAVILIEEEGDPQQLVIPVKADPDADDVHLSGIIPVREKSLIVSGAASRSTNGSIAVPDEFSYGEVIFTNLTESPILIPMGSIISTSEDEPILFETTQPGETPQGLGEEVSIEIKALDAGTSGNVEAGQISRINQEFGADLSVINPDPISGGTDLEIPAPNLTDRSFLSSSLISQLELQALDQIKKELSDSDVLFDRSLYLIEIIDEQSNPEIGAPGDTLTISRTLEFGIGYASGQVISNFANETIRARYHGSDLRAVPESLTITTPDVAHNMDSWTVTLKWMETIDINSQEIIQLITGKDPSEAKEIIQNNLELDNQPIIKLKPGWWIRLPLLPFRISVSQEGG